MIFHRVTLCLIAMLALPAQAENLVRITAKLPDLASPPQGDSQWIARSMRMNGLPMTLKAFQSRLAPEAVLAHYESQFKLQGTHDTRRFANAPWQVLMLRARDYLVTVHARAVSQGSEGTILVSPTLALASARVQTEFPRPSSAQVVNLQQYDDDGMESEHISLSSPRSPFIELQAFSQVLIRDGWTVLDTRPALEVHRGYVLEAQRQAEHARLLILPDAFQPTTTAIVIAWRKS